MKNDRKTRIEALPGQDLYWLGICRAMDETCRMGRAGLPGLEAGTRPATSRLQPIVARLLKETFSLRRETARCGAT